MDPIKFDWDRWNIQKNEIKHGISSLEAESVFFDPELKIFEDNKHSTKNEKRYIAYGLSFKKNVLMVGFAVRQKKIRIITARPSSKKERNIYEENT